MYITIVLVNVYHCRGRLEHVLSNWCSYHTCSFCIRYQPAVPVFEQAMMMSKFTVELHEWPLFTILHRHYAMQVPTHLPTCLHQQSITDLACPLLTFIIFKVVFSVRIAHVNHVQQELISLHIGTWQVARSLQLCCLSWFNLFIPCVCAFTSYLSLSNFHGRNE